MPETKYRCVLGFDGEQRMVPVTPEEEAERAAEVAAWELEKAQPKPPTLEERIAALEAKLAAK